MTPCSRSLLPDSVLADESLDCCLEMVGMRDDKLRLNCSPGLRIIDADTTISSCIKWGCIPSEGAGLQLGGLPGFATAPGFPGDGCGQRAFAQLWLLCQLGGASGSSGHCSGISGPRARCWFLSLKPYSVWDQGIWEITYFCTIQLVSSGHWRRPSNKCCYLWRWQGEWQDTRPFQQWHQLYGTLALWIYVLLSPFWQGLKTFLNSQPFKTRTLAFISRALL